MDPNNIWDCRRKRIFEIIEIWDTYDYPSRAYDFLNAVAIVVNLVVSVMYTFDDIRSAHGTLLLTIEAVTVAFFFVDYLLRLWTVKFLYPGMPSYRSFLKYVFSFTGIVDLLSFLPYYLPIFFPSGSVAFRMFRVMRIFRLFRINAYYDSLNVISEVIASKRQQLFSSVFIILILMLASSLCMYSLEHDAQPDGFTNAFSGIWWAVSTLLTVGYGDIYPITDMGRLFSIILTFLGVGMVAIPTGIISAGFVDQYSRVKQISEYASEEAVRFIKVHLTEDDHWAGKTVKDIGLPYGVIVAAIQRNGKIIVPRGNVTLWAGDTLVLGAESYQDDQHIDLKEVVLRIHHPWNKRYIRDLDISRQTFIIMVKREGKIMIPKGDLMLQEGDHVILYSQKYLSSASSIHL